MSSVEVSSGYTAAILVAITALSLIHYYTTVFNHLKRLGVKGPTPYPFFGSLLDQLFGDRLKQEREWPKKFGKVYCIFHGANPRIVIGDPEVMQQVCIKDFASFPNHEAAFWMNKYQRGFIFFSQDEDWKRMRSIQSPTFTSGKIKRMYKLLDRCADDLVLNFAEQLNDGVAGNKIKPNGTNVNLKDIYSLYTMDAITTVGYTVKLDRKIKNSDKSPRGSFVYVASRIFDFSILRFMMVRLLPQRLLESVNFSLNPVKYFKVLDDRVRPLLKQRRDAAKKADDYLQILVDACMDDQLKLDELDDKENHHAGLTREIVNNDQINLVKDVTSQSDCAKTVSLPGSKLKLTDDEIVSSAIFLLVVGLETTATLLTHCTYALAFHPDIQQTLYETVRAIAKSNPQNGEQESYSFEYDTLTSCEYLDAVISETLRCMTSVVTMDRVAKHDYYIEKYGVQVRKGDKLNLALYGIMNNPEFWQEPLKFNPERFVGENKRKIVPGSYCPFGLGPRHCLGMRFSLTETKLALAKVLMRFKFEPEPDTTFPPAYNKTIGLSHIKNPTVKLMTR